MRDARALLCVGLAFAMLAGSARPGLARVLKTSARLQGVEWLEPKGFRPADLDGRIVVVEFWTFACVNCQATFPAVRKLDSVLGTRAAFVSVHTPELAFERDASVVRSTLARERLRFPVAQDNDSRAWRAFDNHYWPAFYVLDPSGRIRYTHIGELHEGTPDWSRLLKAIDDLAPAVRDGSTPK